MTDILLYGIIGDSFDGLDAKSIIAQVQATDDDLLLRINSPGGYVMEGLAIYNFFKSVRDSGRVVNVQIDALAASMASVIAMVGENIIMADNALMMIHNPWDCACGDAAELRRKASQLDLIRDNLVKIYGAQTAIDAATLTAMLEAETWLTADQALAQNFITAIESASAAQALGCDIQKLGFQKAPNHPAVQGIAWNRAAAAAFINPKGVTNMPNTTQLAAAPVVQPVAIVTPPAPTALTQADLEQATASATAAATAAELERGTQIRNLCAQHKLPDEFMAKLIADKVTLPEARAAILDRLSGASDALNIGGNSRIVVGADESVKARTGIMNSIFQRAGVSNLISAAAKARGETVDLDPGEYRGAKISTIARAMLTMAGVKNLPFGEEDIIKAALDPRGPRGAITQSTSDFPIMLQDALHKTLLAAYATTPDTWSRWLATGSVSDFRPHHRYRAGTIGGTYKVLENGEIKTRKIPDGAKTSISADERAFIINITRKMLVNDDLSFLSDLAVQMGRSAKRDIEIAAYEMLSANGGNGAVFGDNPFFHATNENLAAAGAAMSAASFNALRVAMASQKDISKNDILDLRPHVLVCPIGLGSTARSINEAVYDTDTAGKFQKPNTVNGLFSDIVDTARLTGNRYYAFADPSQYPAGEVVFLNGEQEPTVESQEGWNVLGSEMRVVHDWGIGWRDPKVAYSNPGAA